MKLTSTFGVPSAPDKVLALFLDAATMRACIPGCEDLAQVDDTHYQGTLVNEVAHVKFKAGFTAEITSSTAPANTREPAVVRAVLKGEDRRLGSTIKVDATLTVVPSSRAEGTRGAQGASGAAGTSRPDGVDSSDVTYELELALWGKLGRLGESVIRRRTIEVERQFVEALTAVCSGQPVPQQASQPLQRRSERRAARQTPPSAEATAEAASPSAPSGPNAPSPAVPVERRREDWVILGLTAAAALAYGVIIGGRRGSRR